MGNIPTLEEVAQHMTITCCFYNSVFVQIKKVRYNTLSLLLLDLKVTFDTVDHDNVLECPDLKGLFPGSVHVLVLGHKVLL